MMTNVSFFSDMKGNARLFTVPGATCVAWLMLTGAGWAAAADPELH